MYLLYMPVFVILRWCSWVGVEQRTGSGSHSQMWFRTCGRCPSGGTGNKNRKLRKGHREWRTHSEGSVVAYDPARSFVWQRNCEDRDRDSAWT